MLPTAQEPIRMLYFRAAQKHFPYNKKAYTKLFRSVTSYNLTHVARLPGYPKDAASNIVNVSFYVTNPSTSTPVPRKVLASMLLTQESILENALSQQVVLQTFAGPDTPPVASSEQITNSVVIRISSFSREQVCMNFML
jgi:hypothetical protein